MASKFSRSATIAAEPAVVLAFALNPRNAHKITPQILEVQQIPEGPIGVGTILRETRRQGGRTTTTDVEVVKLDWQKGFTACAEVGGIVVTYQYTVSEVSEGCLIAMRCEVVGKGFNKLMTPIVAKVMEKMDGDQLDRLKQVLEASL